MPSLTCLSCTCFFRRAYGSCQEWLIPASNRTELYALCSPRWPFCLWFWFLVLPFISPWGPEPSSEPQIDFWGAQLSNLIFASSFWLKLLSLSALYNGCLCLSPNTGHRAFQDRIGLQLGSLSPIMWISLFSLKTISDFLLPVRQNPSSLLRYTSSFITWFQPLSLVPLHPHSMFSMSTHQNIPFSPSG